MFPLVKIHKQPDQQPKMSIKLEIIYNSALAFFVFSMVNAEFIRYRSMEKKKVSASSKAHLMIKNTFRVSDPLFCNIKCNQDSSCSAVTIENEKDCTMFTNETTLFDLEDSTTSVLMTKKELPKCPWKTRSYNENLNICVLLPLHNEVCSDSCMHFRGLKCQSGKCQCLNPDLRLMILCLKNY